MSNWVSANRYLGQKDMENNAAIIYPRLSLYKWTEQAIAAVLGNMQTESTINPGIWESLKPFEGGYGLVQWTPYTKYSEWAGVGWEGNGDRELSRIIFESENELQWRTDLSWSYKMSFKEFTRSTKTPTYLADVWLKNYERPADLDQPKRGEQAEKWYTFITGLIPDYPDPDPTPPEIPDVPTDPDDPEHPEIGWKIKKKWYYFMLRNDIINGKGGNKNVFRPFR